MIFDPRCGSDHYTLWVIHGKAVGLTEEQVHNATPLPSTRAALCGWIYLAFNLPWVEGLGGVAVLERVNLDPIIPGGAHQTRSEKRWMEDLGLKAEQLPNFRIHREADTDHKSRVDDLPALVLVARARRHVRVLPGHPLPRTRVAFLKCKTLGIRTVSQNYRVPAALHRPIDVGTQDQAVIHRNRHVPVDPHAVPDFALHLAHLASVAPQTDLTSHLVPFKALT